MKPTEELLQAAETCRLIAGEAIDDSWERHWLILAGWLELEASLHAKDDSWINGVDADADLRYNQPFLAPYLNAFPCFEMARKINREAQP